MKLLFAGAAEHPNPILRSVAIYGKAEGPSGRHKIFLIAITPDAKPTAEKIHEWQVAAGYHPLGYGGSSLLASDVCSWSGLSTYIWTCAASCD